MPETDFEKERRRLRELEGKNIANYSVLLSEWIKATMDNVRIMVILSGAGIGLLVLVMMAGWVHAWWRPVIAIGAFLGFFSSLLLSMGILERNAGYLLQSINVGSDKRLDLENSTQGGKKLFFFGCLCLIVLGLSSAEDRLGKVDYVAKKKQGVVKELSSGQANLTQMNDGQAVGATKYSYEVGGSLHPGADADGANMAPVRNVVRTAPVTGRARETEKVPGNAGNFRSGRAQ